MPPTPDSEVVPEPDAGVDAGEEPEACDACESDEDCADDSRCHVIGEVGVCLPDCSEDADCPRRFRCSDGDEPFCQPGPAVCLGCDNPGMAVDDCDGYDNDCDGKVDEDFAPEVCGVGACAGQSRCEDGEVVPCEDGIGMPAPDDSGCDGVDDDCDGALDEDYVPVECGEGSCTAYARCVDGVETECVPRALAARLSDHTCDGIDDDCDGQADEDYAPFDCGAGACLTRSSCVDGAEACMPPEAAPADVACDGVDEDCDGQVDEDFATEETCGLGRCEAQAECAGGEMSCEPAAPLFVDVDQICDGLDEDCDGEVDEDCVDNALGFRWIADNEETVTIDVVFGQSNDIGTPSARFFMPRLIELVIVLPNGLEPLPLISDTVEPGPATVAADKLLNAVAEDGNRLRITILSVRNSLRIPPGVIAHLHLRRFPDAEPPFRLDFDPLLSAFAPEEAHDRLTLLGADLVP